MDTFCPLNGHVLSMISPFAFLRTFPCALNKLSLSMTSPFVLLSGALNGFSLSVTSFILLRGLLLWALIHLKIIRATTFHIIRLTKIEFRSNLQNNDGVAI